MATAEHDFDNSVERRLTRLAGEIFESLAQQFPVCMASDEFHFFPQAVAKTSAWLQWDDFSPAALAETLGRLSLWENQLASLPTPPALKARVIDAAMLLRAVRTLRDQLLLTRIHESQPTFYLTIMGIGLMDALEAGPRTFERRLMGLPVFLDQARQNLVWLPRLFRDMGIDMLVKQRHWLDSLAMPDDCRASLHQSLQRLEVHLRRATVTAEFLPTVELYERISFDHMGCGLTPDAIARELADEIAETQEILIQTAAAMASGRPWQRVVKELPKPSLPRGGVCELFQETVSELARHCSAQGVITADNPRMHPVTVTPIPNYLRPVRSNAAYSMPPVHPPKGGTFFILDTGPGAAIPADYRLLSAHETYPGHHLLDTCRWRHPRLIRRHLEFPIFYEGWASFAEELMFDTGFFSDPQDHLLMAKRRFWRALRGKVDFDMNMRRQTPVEIVDFLISQGMLPDPARAMVQRYSLKPGYQLAYTIGRRRFRRLYDDWCRRQKRPVGFARWVLDQGEIGFDHLEIILRQGD